MPLVSPETARGKRIRRKAISGIDKDDSRAMLS
jgi:hypothetical protein